MQRFNTILLLLVFGALASGVLEVWHQQQHDLEDRVAVAEFLRTHPGQSPVEPEHDDDNCEFHRAMHAPIVSAGFVPLLICFGLFVAFLSQIAPELVPQFAILTCDCRGPPAV